MRLEAFDQRASRPEMILRANEQAGTNQVHRTEQMTSGDASTHGH